MLLLTQTQFVADASSSSGIGALGLDGKAFIIQFVTFILAFLVLQKWAFGPIIRIMDQRRKTIEEGVNLGEEMRKERAELDDEVAKELQSARRKADGIVSEAQDAARELTREAEGKARQKADAIVAEAKSRTDQDVARARKQLESEVVGLISDATEAIIGEKLDAQKDAALIDKTLKEYTHA
jgi:F-type H+-transporting ATPase subunit b